MANIRHILITLVGSVVLVGLISLWFGYRTGQLATLLGKDAADPYSELPGPLTPEEQVSAPNDTSSDAPMDTQKTNPTVVFKTTKGDITLELYQDVMPITVGNFLTLVQNNFYDGIKFHRVIDGFMIQGGDPNTKGTDQSTYGKGGPGYTIQDEFVADARLSNVRGTIAMANTGQPNSGGSQFFINLVDNTGLDFDKQPLSSRHPVFGAVISGMDVVDAIGKSETNTSDLPVDPIVIEDIEVKE